MAPRHTGDPGMAKRRPLRKRPAPGPPGPPGEKSGPATRVAFGPDDPSQPVGGAPRRGARAHLGVAAPVLARRGRRGRRDRVTHPPRGGDDRGPRGGRCGCAAPSRRSRAPDISAPPRRGRLACYGACTPPPEDRDAPSAPMIRPSRRGARRDEVPAGASRTDQARARCASAPFSRERLPPRTCSEERSALPPPAADGYSGEGAVTAAP
jgi:hypothetical protein